MNLPEAVFIAMHRAKIMPLDRFVLIDCCRRYCRQQHVDTVPVGVASVPVRLVWNPLLHSCGMTQATYRASRRRLVAAGFLDRCRDEDKVRADGRPKVLRDYYVLTIR